MTSNDPELRPGFRPVWLVAILLPFDVQAVRLSLGEDNLSGAPREHRMVFISSVFTESMKSVFLLFVFSITRVDCRLQQPALDPCNLRL